MSTKLKPQQGPLTPDQESAKQKMLATPCPYCTDPERYQGSLKGEVLNDRKMEVARIGKFWKRPVEVGAMFVATSHDYDDHWQFKIPGKNFIDRFKNFSIDVVSFESEYSTWHYASYAPLARLTANPDTRSFNVCRITHEKSPIIVEAHTWFNHHTMITVRGVPVGEFKSADLDVVQEAMEFFRTETRGEPKIDNISLVKALQKFGEKAMPKDVAKELGVGSSTLREWRARQGLSWDELKERYLKTENW